jgi:hypothetical protein
MMFSSARDGFMAVQIERPGRAGGRVAGLAALIP